jgi:phosphatidate cytidylyltransferase
MGSRVSRSEKAGFRELTESDQQKAKMGNLTARVLTSVVLVPLLLLVVFWEREEGWWVLVFLAGALGGWELSVMTLGREKLYDNIAAVVLSLIVGAGVYWWAGFHADRTVLLITGAVAFILLYCLFTTTDVKAAGARVSGLFVTVFYAGLLFPFVALLRCLPNGSWWVVLALAATWLGDTGAYFMGRFLGKHKLFPLVSPKKTWEGALGGVLSTITAALAAHFWFLKEIGILQALLLGLLASIVGQSGDLCESLLKRSYGIKDSGNILPGHGGIMDRVDALVFVAPLVYVFASFVVY